MKAKKHIYMYIHFFCIMNEYILREYSQAMEVDVYNEIRGISSD